MFKPYLITAVGTPLTESERLHVDGLRAHLHAQSNAGIDAVLVAGTMGLLQLLTDQTYEELVRQAVETWRGRGELLIGVGDASFVRTRDRILFVERFEVDGVVALAPYFMQFSQAELITYYEALAAESRVPLYLYDLPQRTRTNLAVETVLHLARHPNIRGIKCSGDIEQTRQLVDALVDKPFRVIVAKPTLLDILLRHGMREHLDGIFGFAPNWMRAIARSASREDWPEVTRNVKSLANLLAIVLRYGVYPSMTVILNEQGVPGNFAPRPFLPLTDEQRQQLLEEHPVRALLGDGVK
jgi:4-hydroxy-tetrahydrodipicolinate synthase